MRKKHMKEWMKREKRKVTPGLLALFGAKAWIDYQPLGVVGVISPWNFPSISLSRLYLVSCPLAIAA